MQTFIPACFGWTREVNELFIDVDFTSFVLSYTYACGAANKKKPAKSGDDYFQRWNFMILFRATRVMIAKQANKNIFLITSLSSAGWWWLRCRCTWYWIKSISDREMHFPSGGGWSLESASSMFYANRRNGSHRTMRQWKPPMTVKRGGITINLHS